MEKQASKAGSVGESSLEIWRFSDERNDWSYSFVKVRKYKISLRCKTLFQINSSALFLSFAPRTSYIEEDWEIVPTPFGYYGEVVDEVAYDHIIQGVISGLVKSTLLFHIGINSGKVKGGRSNP